MHLCATFVCSTPDYVGGVLWRDNILCVMVTFVSTENLCVCVFFQEMKLS